jgi:hypothetical protein
MSSYHSSILSKKQFNAAMKLMPTAYSGIGLRTSVRKSNASYSTSWSEYACGKT